MEQKPLLSKSYLLLLIITFYISMSAIAQPASWSHPNSSDNHSILIQSTSVITVNGGNVDIGDYIGVFFIDNGAMVCAGYTEWDGNVAAISAWGDDTSNPVKTGFDTGELFNFKIWDSSANMEFNAVVTWLPQFPNQGTYFPNGMSGIATAISSSSIVPTVTGTTCYGMSDGAIDIVITSGVAPYTYLWSNGATSQNISGLSAGSYEVTVTDISSTSDSLTIEVTEPGDLTANILVNESNAFMCMAEAEVFPTGGTGPYSYLWNTIPSQTAQLAELCPGLHNVTITDANNCQTNLDVIVDTTSQNVIDSVFTIIDTCIINFLPDTVYISNLYISSGYMIIEWTFEFPGSSFILTSNYPGNVFPGVYYVGLVVNCPTKSFASLTFVEIFNIPPMILFTAMSDETSCPGQCDGNINLSVTSGSPPYTYLWSNGETTQDINNLCSGNYSVTVSDTNGSNTVEYYEVIDATPIQVSETVVNLLCNDVCDGSINLNITGGTAPYQYLWSNGETSDNITNLCAIDYNITITDSNGCTEVTAYGITEPAPVVTISSVIASSCSCCDDGNIDLSVTGGVAPYEFMWTNGETTEDVSNLYSGTYVAAITDANGCTYSKVIAVGGPAPLAGTAYTTDISCNGQNDGSINILVEGGNAPFTYTWSNGEATSLIESLSAGSYEITITDSDGCSTTSVYEITQPELLEITEVTQNATSYGICDGVIDIGILGGTSPYTFIWSNGSTTLNQENLCAGDYTVTITDINNCTQTQTMTVTEPNSVFNIDSDGFSCDIHPNPILDNLNLYITNTKSNFINVEVFNSIGSKLYMTNIEINETNKVEISLPDLTPGVYFVKVFNDNKQSTILRFIK